MSLHICADSPEPSLLVNEISTKISCADKSHLFFLQALDLDSITTHHWLIQGCSAVTGENLLLGIDWIIDDIASRIFTMD